MTKEQFLKSEYSKLIMNPDKVYAQNPSIIQAAHTAMDEYAKQQAISFADYKVINNYQGMDTSDEGVIYNVPGKTACYTTSELYNRFLNTL